MITFKILAGLATSLEIEKFWTTKFCFFVGRKLLGFSGPHGVHPMLDPREFYSLRLSLLLSREESSNRPGFEHIEVPPSLQEWNKSFIKARQLPGRKCPKKLKCQCYLCPMGQDQCNLAVHSHTYIFAECTVCQADEAPFDPAVSLQLCVNCIERRALQGNG